MKRRRKPPTLAAVAATRPRQNRDIAESFDRKSGDDRAVADKSKKRKRS